MINVSLTHKLKTLPSSPGCYLYKNAENKIIYVGKAKNLKARVSSYFVGAHDLKTTQLVSKIADLDYIITSSEKEALILELNLIKKHRPRFNILYMDDKSYLYIKLNKKGYPHLKVARDRVHDSNYEYFGPYPNAKAARETVKLLNGMYPLRKCRTMPNKVCFYYHLGQCLGPCEFEIDDKIIAEMRQKTLQILKGQTKELIDQLIELRDMASESLLFEQAAEYQSQIENIGHIAAGQNMISTTHKDMDIFNYQIQDGFICVVGLLFRNGQMLNKTMTLQPLNEAVEDALDTILIQFYQKNPKPKTIVVPNDIELDLLNEFLDNRVVHAFRGQRAQLLKLAATNAANQLRVHFESAKKKPMVLSKALADLEEMVGLADIYRIELIDVSHISGTNAVAGLVVFEEGLPVKSRYRRYKVEEGNHDVASIKEVVYRRLLRQLKEKENLADLLIVDGGKPQVNGAKEIIEVLGLDLVVCGLVKDDRHQTRGLLLSSGEEIDIFYHQELLTMLTHMQDEMHRFALSYHRQLRSKTMVQSQLDSISGLGPVRKEKLLKRFGSYRKIKEATVEELIATLGKKVGQSVYEQLQKQ